MGTQIKLKHLAFLLAKTSASFVKKILQLHWPVRLPSLKLLTYCNTFLG